MRPTDPRVLSQLSVARRELTGVVAGGVIASVLVVTQAFVITGFVVAALRGSGLVPWALLVCATLAGRALVGLLVDVLSARAGAAVATDMRRRLMRAVLEEGSSSRAVRSSGELAALATRGVSAAEPYLTRYVPALVLASILPILTVVAIASQDLISAGIVLITLPLVPLFGALVGLATRDRAESQWRAMASLSGHFLDVMKGLPTLVAFRRAEAQSATIREITERYRRASLKTLRIAFASSAVLELVATLSVALVAVVVGLRLAAGGMDLRTALVVLLLAPEAYWPLRRVGAEFHAAAEGVVTFEALSALADTSPLVAEVTAPGGDLEVNALTVLHPGRRTPALEGLSTRIPGRGITVVTGPSGAGKSTLLSALAGLVTPTTGSIRVGGVEVGGAPWRSQIAWLPQRPLFLSGSVADNLRLANPSATDADLWLALRRVALEERVRLLDGGLDGAVGEDGRFLSAGERARLALARVVLSERPWVFLDEPTAHLDELTERIIADTIVELGRVSGVVVVSHRQALDNLADHTIALRTPLPEAADEQVAPGAPAPVASIDTAPTSPAGRLPFLGSTILGALSSASGVALTATAGWLIVQASLHPPVLTLLVAIVGVRTFGLARPVLRYAERLRSHDTALRLLGEQRVQVYDAVVPLTPGRLGRQRGDVLASIVDDVDAVLDQELRVRLPVRGFLLVSTLTVGVATAILPAAGAVVAATCVLGGGVGHLVARLGGARAEARSIDQRAILSAKVVEGTQIATDLVMWQAEDSFVDEVVVASKRLAGAHQRSALALGIGRSLVLLAAAAGAVTLGVFASREVGSGSLSQPLLALLVLLPIALIDVMLPMVEAGGLHHRARAAQQRLRDLERLVPAVSDPAAPSPAPASYELEMRGVSGGWGAVPALSGLDLRLGPDERLGIVGPSGSGKSTLAAMLLRFIDPAEGDVSLGGVSLPRLALDDVRRHIGLVDDDPHIFATTLVENIRLARPAASDTDVEVALRQAHLGPWLDELPAGLHTWLGEGHDQVSGGERARLGVARSLLADSRVLVLDEPTAHLDTVTASAVMDDLLAATSGRSTIWITHELAGLDRMDHVVDLGRTSA